MIAFSSFVPSAGMALISMPRAARRRRVGRARPGDPRAGPPLRRKRRPGTRLHPHLRDPLPGRDTASDQQRRLPPRGLRRARGPRAAGLVGGRPVGADHGEPPPRLGAGEPQHGGLRSFAGRRHAGPDRPQGPRWRRGGLARRPLDRVHGFRRPLPGLPGYRAHDGAARRIGRAGRGGPAGQDRRRAGVGAGFGAPLLLVLGPRQHQDRVTWSRGATTCTWWPRTWAAPVRRTAAGASRWGPAACSRTRSRRRRC